VRRVYVAIGWGIILLGAVHMFATTRLFSGVSERAIWFLSGGIAMALAGALNLLNEAYGSIAPGVKRVAIVANIVMTLLGLVAGMVTGASAAELVIVVGLMGSATALSLLKR